MMLGLRGFPDVQGGVEKHVECLSRELLELGCDVEVVMRSQHVKHLRQQFWNGIRVRKLWAPRMKGLEAAIHTFLGVFVAAWRRPDVLHIHAIGPGLMAPLARLFGLKVVVTHHGHDYEREKWGGVAKAILRLGEVLGMRFANERIVITRQIDKHVHRSLHLESVVIPNGVEVHPPISEGETMARLGLEAKRYVLMVARIVPEKRQIDLVKAFRAADLPGWKLVLVGSAQFDNPYAVKLARLINEDPSVVAPGLMTGTSLGEIYSNAGIFVLPSSHEGLPIVLLEAVGYGLPIAASDIPANREVGLSDDSYFECGNIGALTRRLSYLAGAAEHARPSGAAVLAQYNWPHIAQQVRAVYMKACGR